MTIRTKYVNEMDGIKVDEELKKTIINKAISSAAGSSTVPFNFAVRSRYLLLFA